MWFPNHRKFLDQSNCVVTDSLRIIEQSAGFHGVFASESLRTGQINLTREEGMGRELCRKTKIAI